MAIVSDLPFKLQVILHFPKLEYQSGVLFSDDEREIWEKNIVTLTIEENEELELFFNSSDSNARLYLEALDIIPADDRGNLYDDRGRIYRTPNRMPFVLYKDNSGYDALCVDMFQISIYCEEKWYYGIFQVLPKPMNMEEWTMMKEELEEEMSGLAQDIARHNIGIGKMNKKNLPPQALQDFIVIKKYSQAVLTALIDIAKNPRYGIITEYKKTVNHKNYRLDGESVRRYVTRAGSEATYNVPQKVINYDIQDNRLLKKILLEYEKSLDRFIQLLAQTLDEGKKTPHRPEWEGTILNFRSIALKLKKMTTLLKTKEWYLGVKEALSMNLPYSFVLDTRYNTIYQMYMELKNSKFQVAFDPEFSYTWKRSSYLYEMWCYFKVCHLLAEEYEMLSSKWNQIFAGKMLFPLLNEGTMVEFEDKKVRLKVVFDKAVKLQKTDTDLEDPLYIAKSREYSGSHNRPDILLHVYDRENNWYLGSIVLECKYRKLYSFWREGTARSSIGQLQAYYNNMRSEYQYGGMGKRLNIIPVKKVIVLTPDIHGDGQEQEDFNILIKALKPSDSQEWSQSLLDEIRAAIDDLKENSRDMKHLAKFMN